MSWQAVVVVAVAAWFVASIVAVVVWAKFVSSIMRDM